MSSDIDAQTEVPHDDDLRLALTNQHCRFVLHHFSGAAGDAASIGALSAAFARENDVDADRVAVRLHHVALPKLSSIGVVDYEAESGAVRYSAHSRVEDRLRLGESDSDYAVVVQ